MSVEQGIGLALLSAALAFLIKPLSPRLAIFPPLFCGLALLVFALSRYREPLSLLTELAEQGGLSDALSAILRMLGVGLITSFTADLCRDLGEGTLASRVELCGRVEILLLCLPFLSELLSLAVEVGV